MKAKHRHRKKLVEYLSDPNNDWIKRQEYHSKVLGLRGNNGQLYNYFSSQDLDKIEKEALELRRKRYSSVLSSIDKALISQALQGSVQAIKLCYQRFEGWKTSRRLNIG